MSSPPHVRWPGIRVLAVLVVVLFAGWRWFGPSSPDSSWQMAAAKPLADGKYHCEYVVDGDTIVVWPYRETGPDPEFSVTLRLLGINAPADGPTFEPYGSAATAFLKERLEGKDFQLQWDKRRIDRVGRRLGYVYLEEVLLNQELVLQGLARVFAYPGDNGTIAQHLYRAEQAARLDKRGIWSDAQTAAADVVPAE